MGDDITNITSVKKIDKIESFLKLPQDATDNQRGSLFKEQDIKRLSFGDTGNERMETLVNISVFENPIYDDHMKSVKTLKKSQSGLNKSFH